MELPAMLLAPHNAEGMVVFDTPDEHLSVRGDFFPTTKQITLSAIEGCQLFLSESRIMLQVVMFPAGRLGSTYVDRFHFQLVDWQSLQQISRLPPDASKPN